MNSEKSRPGLLPLGVELFRLGALAFGGLGVTLSLLQRQIVERDKWIQQSDISEALAFTKALPGSTGIQVVAYLGWKMRGWPGAIVASTAFISPAAVLMIAVAAGSLALPDTSWVRGALTGLIIGVIGLLLAAMWRLARGEAKNPILVVVILVAALLGFFTHAVVIVIGAGLIGALLNKEPDDA
jgi:chromate transporter